MKVLKFGGSSVATPERINHLIDLVEPRIKSGEELAIVCSGKSVIMHFVFYGIIYGCIGVLQKWNFVNKDWHMSNNLENMAVVFH